MLEAARNEFSDVTEKFIATGEELFGPYVWERYDILVLPPSFPCMLRIVSRSKKERLKGKRFFYFLFYLAATIHVTVTRRWHGKPVPDVRLPDASSGGQIPN